MELAEVIEFIKEEELIKILESLIEIQSHINCKNQEKEISNFTAEILKKENIAPFLQKVEPNRFNVISSW